MGVPEDALGTEGGVPQFKAETTTISYACIAQVQFAVYSRAQVTVGGVPVQLPALVPSL